MLPPLANMMASAVISVLMLVTALILTTTAKQPPNIVLVVADDLGWGDIGYHNPDILTPNIDQLAREGVTLNQSYVQPLCSPSRAALMTGTYPYRMGLQHLVIYRGQPVCVPYNKTLLPEVLRNQGYATHMVGKWHLGFCDWRCTPTERGFDSFYGYYNSMEDYYTKTYDTGFDFRDNTAVVNSANGTFSTYLYTDRIRKIITNHNTDQPLFLYLPYQNVHEPLEVPQNYSELYPDIKNEDRRVLSGMVSALDDAVGDLVASLKNKGIYNNTLIVFTADNGGWTTYSGNNYPLRGGKFTIFEGGTRAVGFVHGPMFNKTGATYNGLMHIVDWFPTLVEAAGATYAGDDQDGISQWEALQTLSPSPRDEILYNLDLTWDPIQGRAAIRVGDYKFVDGFPGLYPEWYPPATQVSSKDGSVNLNSEAFPYLPAYVTESELAEIGHKHFSSINAEAPIYNYLFNLKDDPEERVNIYDDHPDIVQELTDRLDYHKSRYRPPNFPLYTPAADPENWGGIWTPGWCPDPQ